MEHAFFYKSVAYQCNFIQIFGFIKKLFVVSKKKTRKLTLCTVLLLEAYKNPLLRINI